ncbi:MAG: VCBS repeat-containing protein, partial [Bacteroidetes bacterium]|nr:VCBS repeat-containing protein [Bacteroidota bacterium]
MKSFILYLALLFAAPLFAQNPVQDKIPQLKEWWRVDNMQYGKYGMTWIDNFYNGKGALAVWTPQGVKTWLLRFPGDTADVFTWQKGGSYIKTGDINGDKITDYIDENSNIYEGVKNGEPPKPEPVSFGKYYSEAIADINGDGYDDLINTPTLDYVVSATQITVCFGKQGLKDMSWQNFKIKDIDSNNTVITCYTTPNKE